jgi:nucleoside-diphosphate-sugar epimerase
MGVNFITGGLGYVGINLAHELVAKGEDVVIFDMLPDSPRIADIKDKVRVIQGQLGDWAQVMEAVHSTKPDTIYHLGAMITMPAEANPWAAYMTNANGLYHILEAARHFDVKNVVWPSGIAVYAPGVGDVVNENTYESNPTQMYATTKIFGERLGEYYHHKFGLNFRAPSFPAICGPGRKAGLSAYASIMAEETAKGAVATLPVNETTQMPFIYIKDVVRCLIMIKDVAESKMKRRVYSIQGFSLPAGEMAKTILKLIPDAVINFNPDAQIVKLAAAAPKMIDDSRARKDWGWEPKFDWEHAVKDFIAEVK